MRPPAPSRSALRAVPLMVVATALVAATALLAKAIGAGVLGGALNPLQISFGRFGFGLLTLLAVAALWRGTPAPRLPGPPPPAARLWLLHLGRTVCGWSGITLLFAAIAHLPLADATALSFLGPVVTMLLAIPLLGERVGPVRWAAAAIALAGALILLRPGAGTFQPAALLALGAAVGQGLEAIFIKRLSGLDRPMRILLVNNAMGAVLSGLVAAAVWQAPTAAQWMALAATGAMMVTGQAFYLGAMRAADASFVAPLFYLTLAFAALFDFAVFGVLPDAISLTGALVLVSGAGLLAWREGRAARAQGFIR